MIENQYRQSWNAIHSLFGLFSKYEHEKLPFGFKGLKEEKPLWNVNYMFIQIFFKQKWITKYILS